MEIIEIGCPRSINLKSISSLNEKYKEAKYIMQTINIYDYISIRKEIKQSSGIKIISKDDLSDNLKDSIREILNIFFKYIGLNIKDLIIEINFDNILCLRKEEALLAGLLIGLNDYFKVQLTVRELLYLAEKVNPFISYYIFGGYKKIKEEGRCYNSGDNPFYKYLLIENFPKDNLDELKRLKNSLLNQNDFFLGEDECVFIATNKIINASIPISIKREFSSTLLRILDNVSGHKVLIKYLK